MPVRKNNVSIRPLPQEEVTKSGIYTGKVESSRVTGEVVEVGPDVESPLQAGQKVLYRKPNCAEADGLHIVSEEVIEAIL